LALGYFPKKTNDLSIHLCKLFPILLQLEDAYLTKSNILLRHSNLHESLDGPFLNYQNLFEIFLVKEKITIIDGGPGSFWVSPIGSWNGEPPWSGSNSLVLVQFGFIKDMRFKYK
jgi:hypothetical protein